MSTIFPDQSEERDISGLRTVFDPETLVKKGLCPVSSIQNGSPLTSHSLYYEQHGTGPEKIVFIMGLNNSSFAWEGQARYFARIEKYSLLVFDNRGVGNSDTPKGPYSTSAMAQDVVTLVDYVGWTKERELNIVGISLGGMISLELATLIPKRISSLTLIVTTAGNTPRPFANLAPSRGTRTLIKTLLIKDPKERIPHVLDMLYPKEYLESKNDEDPTLTNREVQFKNFQRRVEHTRPQQLIGSLSQMFAALFHYVSPARLATINASIPKILILTGDDDHLVDPSNSRHLAKHMPSAEFIVWEKTGHGLPAQWPKRTSELFERVFEEGRKASEKERSAEVTI